MKGTDVTKVWPRESVEYEESTQIGCTCDASSDPPTGHRPWCGTEPPMAPDTAAPWPLGTYVPYNLCGALPPKRHIQQRCLVRNDHVEAGHPHQNYCGLIWSDTEVTNGT